jgi:hypothetical protein
MEALDYHKPSDCALLVAIPLTKERFMLDLARPDEKDYATHVKESRFLDKPEAKRFAAEESHWNVYYKTAAEIILWHCRQAGRLGVTVKTDGTLNDFNELLKKYKVVTLLSHWKFTKLYPSDVFDPFLFFETIEHPQTSVQKSLFREFAQKTPDLLRGKNKHSYSFEELQEMIAAVVNPLLTNAHSFYKKNPYLPENAQDKESELLEVPSLERLTKVTLELNFSHCITPRKAVELADRMYTVSEVVDSIPKNFSGLIDLTVCNSVILGQAIKSSGLKCLAAVSRYQTEPVPRMRIYLQAVRSISKKPESFVDVLTRLLK